VLYYSAYGHVETMAQAVADGARAAGAEVTNKRVPELVSEDVARAAGMKPLFGGGRLGAFANIPGTISVQRAWSVIWERNTIAGRIS
jgi:hypothetical protein